MKTIILILALAINAAIGWHVAEFVGSPLAGVGWFFAALLSIAPAGSLAAACSLMTANIIIDCSRPPIPGTEDTLYIFNKDEISGYTFNGTNPQIIASIIMVATKKGFKLQGNRGSVEPNQALDVQRFFKGYIHLIDAKVFKMDPTAKLQIELLKGGLFVCVVEYKNKGTNGDSIFEVYGYDTGLEVIVIERKPTDLETGGGFNLQFKTPENSREANLPKAFWITDEATTRAALTGVVTP